MRAPRTKAAIALAASVVVLPPAVATAKTQYTRSVALTRGCPIYENYPKPGVPPRLWLKAPAAGRVGIRYNASSRYALVLDYARGNAKPEVNPHWGFIDRGLCLAEQLHKRPLYGKGGNGRYKRVDFRPRAARTTGTRTARGNATLRSGPKSFVTGNLEAGDAFRIGRRCSSHSPSSFVFGYARVARRWGWVQSSRLSGSPCVVKVSLRRLRITTKQTGRYSYHLRHHVTVCGPTGTAVVRFRERYLLGGRLLGQRSYAFRRGHARGCHREIFTWPARPDMAGVGLHELIYRARIGHVHSRRYIRRDLVTD